MAKFNIDFTDAKEFSICDEGEQNFKVVDAELKNYTKDGIVKQKIELTCEVFGGISSGAKVYYSIFLINPSGLYMFLNKIGVNIEKKAYTDLDTNMFIGKLFTANVEHESFISRNGSTKYKAVIVDSSVRKYVSSQGDTTDAFAEFGDSVSVDEFLE